MGTVTAGVEVDEGTEYRVLVVDDEPTMGALVAEYLEHVDGRLDVSHTAAPTTAIERLDGSFDCVVTDYEMPMLDGLSLIERAETDAEFVLFTQAGGEEVAGAAREAGASYMQKRTDTAQYEELAALIRELAGG
ncbi:response regulator [Haloarcula litorea]|uniref:response regulator n=1 Tax=Haloarcula litorea TaxID=3032579 RepID=UPI0023E83A4B|nr:response regulator [Halomicroarcula sp. GDY20]